MNEIFQLKEDNQYNLGQVSQFIFPLVNDVFNGNESVPHIRRKIRKLIPPEIKQLSFLSV